MKPPVSAVARSSLFFSMRNAILLTALCCLTSGCVLVPGGRHQGHAVAASPCHPSQYWDGSQCRHKGQGHGARKHDGRGKGRR